MKETPEVRVRADESGLEQVLARKAVLHGIIGIVRYMERLHDSLEAVLVLGESADNVPANVYFFLESMDEHLKAQTSPKLRVYLERLETLIKNDLGRIVELSEADPRPNPGGSAAGPDPDLFEVVDTFRRRAQTTVSLRVLLRKRGEPVGVVVLPVQEDVLRKSLDSLDKRKGAEEEKVLAQTRVLLAEVNEILAHTPPEGGAQRSLLEMRRELEADLAHLEAGKSVADLPYPVDNTEATDLDWLAPPVKVNQELAEDEPEPEDDPEEETGAESEATDEAEAEPQPEVASAEEDPARVRGFFARLWIYLTTGPEVTWAMARTWQKPEGG